jgi:hypothetical protein
VFKDLKDEDLALLALPSVLASLALCSYACMEQLATAALPLFPAAYESNSVGDV